MPAAIRRLIAFLLCGAAMFGLPDIASAGEQPEHYHLIYTLARATGFPDHEAQIIASASWSVDDNLDTTAYDERRDVPNVATFLDRLYAPGAAQENVAAAELFGKTGVLRHAPRGAVFHALTSEQSRNTLRDYWRRIIDRSTGSERLILTGMYLHFEVDAFVHPGDAVLGHAITGHHPDRAINRPREFTEAAVRVLEVLQDTAQKTRGRDMAGRTIAERMRTIGLEQPDPVRAFCRKLVSALETAYRSAPTYRTAVGGPVADYLPVTPDVSVALKRAAEPTFATVNEKFDIPAVKTFRYAETANGTIKVSAPWIQRFGELTIPGPVAAVRDAVSGPMTSVRTDLVRNVRRYYTDSIIVAAALEAAKNAAMPGAAGVRGVFRAVESAGARADATIQDAANTVSELKGAGQLVYSRSVKSGLRVIHRKSDGAVRVWEAAGDRIQLFEQKAGEAARLLEAPTTAAVAALVPRAQTGVGGVRLGYALDVLHALDARTASRETAVTTLHGEFRLVSLRGLLQRIIAVQGSVDRLDDSTKWFGNLSRIHGFVVDREQGDVVVVGIASPQGRVIGVEDVIVALRAVYRDGLVPTFSLDMNPRDRAGPQHVRVEGVPADSNVARVMLDADYQMKKIMFGVAPVSAVGYRSHAELLRAARDVSEGFNRYWFSPIQPGPGDIHISAARDQALFSGQLQVLTEAQEQTTSGLRGTGTVDLVAAEAARLFTARYDAIERDYPAFRSLQALNDVVLFATLLRRLEVRTPVLDRLMDQTLSGAHRPTLPRSMPAVSAIVKEVDVPGGRRVLGLQGGVLLRTRAARGSWALYTDRQMQLLRELSRRLTASGGLTIDTGLDTVVVSVPRGRRDSADLATEAGRQLLFEGRYQDAADQFTRAIDADETATEGYIGRAVAASALGRPRAALRDIARARVLEPSDDDIQAAELTIRIDSGRELEALARPAGISPGVRARVVRGFVERGLAQHQRRQYSEAQRSYSVAIQLDPQSAEAYMYRGIVATDMANPQSQFREFSQAFKDFAEAIRLNPRLAEAYAHRSWLKTLAFDYEGAITDATRAIDLDLADAFSYNARAVASARLKRFGDALNDLSRVMKLAPGSPVAYANRAIIRAMQGDFRAAQDDAAYAIQLGDSDAKTYVLRGRARFELRDYRGAIDDATQAITREPMLATAFVLRGVASLGQRPSDLDTVTQDLRQALKLDNAIGKDIEALAKKVRPDVWPVLQRELALYGGQRQ